MARWHQTMVSAIVVTAGTLVLSLAAHATTYQIGPTRGAARDQLSDVVGLLNAGDRVEVDGDATYGSVAFTRPGGVGNPITIIGLRVNGNRPIISGGANTVAFTSPSPYTSGADHYVFEGFEVTGGASRCIYHQAGDLTIRDVVVHDCPAQGILGADNGAGSLVLEYSEVYNCGNGTQNHQIYMSSDETNRPGSVFRMQFNYVHDGVGGNNVKSRAERNEIYYNWIEGAYYRELELIGCDPGGGCSEGDAREDSDVVGNVLIQRRDWYIVRIGGDGTGQSWGRYRFVNNTIVGLSNAALQLFDGIESLELSNNVFYRVSGVPDIAPLTDAVWQTGSPVIVGSNNWMKSGATNNLQGYLTGTVTGADPSFTNLTGNDLVPLAGSPLVDAGIQTTVSPVGHAIPNPLPLPLYHPPQHVALAVGTAGPRPSAGLPDIGAFEVGGTPTCVDADGDGYGSPASALCTHPELDCDDGNADVTDCNGTHSPVSVVSGCGCTASDSLGHTPTLWLLILVGASLRSRRRTKWLLCHRA